jgi:DNA-binding response OmpR family regulator
MLKNAQTKRHTELPLPKILIVEDNEGISDVLRELFQMIGYRCTVRQTAIGTHQLVKDEQPSLVDCAAFYADHCSAYPKVLLSLGTYGSDAFIPKPFNLNELTEKIEQLLDARVF